MVNKFADVIKKQGVKEQSDVKGKYGILAVHGGQLDYGTEKIAQYVHKNAEEGASSLYVMSSVKGEAKNHRVSSTQIAHTKSKHLNDVVENVKEQGGHFVSIHGHNWKNHDKKVYVGGNNDEAREDVASKIKYHLEKAGIEGYEIVSDTNQIPKNLRGTGERNLANRVGEEGGVQIEFPIGLRKGDNAKIVGEALKEYINDAYKKEVKYEKAA